MQISLHVSERSLSRKATKHLATFPVTPCCHGGYHHIIHLLRSPLPFDLLNLAVSIADTRHIIHNLCKVRFSIPFQPLHFPGL